MSRRVEIPTEIVPLPSTNRAVATRRHRDASLFLRGPVPLPWLAIAARLPGAALHVGVMLWFRSGLTSSRQVVIGSQLREQFGLSLIEQLTLTYKFSDKYRDKDDTTRSLLGKPGDSAPALMDMDPKVKRAKQPDDSYSWRVSGSFAHLLFNPAPATPRVPAAGGRGATTD